MKSLRLLLPTVLLCAMAGALPALAAGSDPITVLEHQDAYLSTKLTKAGVARSGDQQRLEAQAARARRDGVPEKFLLAASSPYATAAEAAHAVRNTLGFSGVLIVLLPHQMGISSDRLSQDEENAIAAKAGPRCPPSYTNCAIFAGQQAVEQINVDQRTSNHSTSVFWLVVVGILVLLGLFAFGHGRRTRAATQGQLTDLRQAASNTLAQADTAIQTIESETQSGRQLSSEMRAEYDRALGLRETAQKELDGGATPAMLTQANQDAAESVLALQGVMRGAGIKTPLTDPLDAPGHRCFYCGRTDRPPYSKRTISDGRGNSMEVDVCAADAARLQQGKQPQVATVPYAGSQVPWYAVPGNSWYYAYGGPTWQYWLPMMFGMELGSLFGGGWGGPVVGGWGADVGGVPAGQPMPSDAGQADFGGGWDAGSADIGGGWNAGGGSDFGGTDFGGGDSGGGGGWS